MDDQDSTHPPVFADGHGRTKRREEDRARLRGTPTPLTHSLTHTLTHTHTHTLHTLTHTQYTHSHTNSTHTHTNPSTSVCERKRERESEREGVSESE